MSNPNARRNSKLLIVMMATGLGLVTTSCSTNTDSTTATSPEYNCLDKAMHELRDCVRSGLAIPGNTGEYQVRNDCMVRLAADKTVSCADDAVKLADHVR